MMSGWQSALPAFLHFNGIEWIRSNLHTKVPTLNSISFYDSTDGIAAGFGGALIRYYERDGERRFSFKRNS